MKSLQNARILITGASGWLGRETLCLLQREVGPLSDLSLTLAGSHKRSIEIHGESVRIQSLEDIANLKDFDVILHYAFLTQDKIAEFSSEDYLRVNRRINQIASQISKNNTQARQLVLSSGAVVPKYPGDARANNLYAQLKLDFEERISDDRTLILRLWNTSGHHLGTNLNYALSEFIHLAKRNMDIRIRNNVRRSYVSAQDIVFASIKYLVDGGNGLMNSGGFETDLLNLANTVVKVNESSSKIVLASGEVDPSSHYLSPKTEIPQQYFQQQLDLGAQVTNTSAGVC